MPFRAHYHHHYSPNEIELFHDASSEELDWLAISWDYAFMDDKDVFYAQIIVAPGTYIHREGHRSDQPFSLHLPQQHFYRDAYPRDDIFTMMDLALAKSHHHASKGRPVSTPPFVVDFNDMKADFINDDIRTLGDIPAYGDMRAIQGFFDHIHTVRHGIRTKRR